MNTFINNYLKLFNLNKLNLIIFFLYIVLFFYLIFLKYNFWINNDGLLYIQNAFIYDSNTSLPITNKYFFYLLTNKLTHFFGISVLKTLKITFLMTSIISILFYIKIIDQITRKANNFNIIDSFILKAIPLTFHSFYNNYVSYIIRDHFVWMFLIVLVYLLLNLDHEKFIYKKIILVLFFMFFASLFRYEYVFFIISFPIYLLIKDRKFNLIKTKDIYIGSSISIFLLSIYLFSTNFFKTSPSFLTFLNDLLFFSFSPILEYSTRFFNNFYVTFLILIIYYGKNIFKVSIYKDNFLIFLSFFIFLFSILNFYLTEVISFRYIFILQFLFVIYLIDAQLRSPK
jgi:hypothetical protein